MAIFTGAGVAIVTPFNQADESINYDKLDQLIDFHCNNGTDSIIVCGTTGESATMTEEEHAVYKRGRNAKSYTKAKNASTRDYRNATGFEALLGYLYLKEDYKRLTDIVKMALDSLKG